MRLLPGVMQHFARAIVKPKTTPREIGKLLQPPHTRAVWPTTVKPHNS